MEKEIYLRDTNPENQLFVINTLRDNGYSIYEETTGYDPEYPYLVWDGHDLTQSCGNGECYDIIVDTIEEFLSYFNITVNQEPNYEIY